MIERQTVDGREALVAYLTDDITPADRDDATLIKVLFDDGGTLWLVPKREKDEAEDAEFDPKDHPQAPAGAPEGTGGQFVAKGEGGAGGATEPAEGPEEEPAPSPAPKARLRRPGAAAAPPKAPRLPKQPPLPEQTFVSPNTGELSFTGAQHELASRRQKLLAEVAAAIDVRLKLSRVKAADVIGAWTDGAENTLMETYSKSADPKMVRIAAAIKGSIAQQKSALIFQPTPEGKGRMAVFEAKGSLADIHDRLLNSGVPNHTLEATPDGARVHVYAGVNDDGTVDQATIDAVERASEGADVEVTKGDGEFIGTNLEGTDEEQRADAHRVFRDIVEGMADPGTVEGRHIRAVWADAHNHWRAATGTEDGVGLVGSQGDPGLISTRRPSAVGSLESDRYRRIDLLAEKEDAAVFQDHTDRLKVARDYPNLRPSEVESKTPDQIAAAFIAHIKSNLRFLYDHAPKEMRDRAHLWYEGAHDIAADTAKRHGLPMSSVAGVYAALSPQKLWDMNVYLGDNLIEIHQTKQDHKWDGDMSKTATRIWLPKKPPSGKIAIANAAAKAAMLATIQDKTLAQLNDITDPKERLIAKAMWIRTYDEAHSERHFDRLAPDGKSMGLYRNKKTPKQVREGKEGNPATAAWQSIPAISSAIKALESNGDRITISEAMGTQHKVRSFYNNILDPRSKNEDVTMDTHAIGAALLRPLSGASVPVMHSLATSPATGEISRRIGYSKPREQSTLGINGTYAIYAEAYRELAHELKIEPRVLQSVTWEAKRAMFDNSTTDRQLRLAGQAWRAYHAGRADLARTQQRILRIAGGFKRLEDIQDTHD